jgi:hypothetical protein
METKNVSVKSVDVEMSEASSAAIAQTAKEAKDSLVSLAKQFAECDQTIASSSGNATKQMLTQGRIAWEVEERFAHSSSFDGYYIQFREQTNTVSASKWSQYKRIGRVANVLEPYADRLPSGWSVLSSLAVLFDAKTKEGNRKYSFSVDDLLNVKISFTGRKGVKRTKSLTPTSTQSEVRAVVDTLLGKEKREKTVKVSSAYRPTLTIDWGSVDGKTFDAELAALGKSIASLAAKYPWVSFDAASFGRNGLNATAKRVIATKVEHKQLPKVA